MASEWTDMLTYDIEFNQGWGVFVQKFIEDYTGTDNGGFFEIIGEGDPLDAIEGQVLGVANLDSTRCLRTGDPEYPVVYQSPNGGRYKLHFTRVGFASQMPSADESMHGVGFCAISRAISTAQNLWDIAQYQAEKLGSQQKRAILLAKGGLDPIVVGKSLESATSMALNKGFARYMPVAIIGDRTIPNADLALIDLVSLPDGFDFRTSTEIGMALIALAFGIDISELYPGQGGGTRAEALIQHLKQRGKGPGETLQTLENIFNSKVLPNVLEIKFDFQDDAEDRQSAEIHQVRANTYQTELTAEIKDIRTVREQMLADGDITQSQFEALELEDGRLGDGLPVISLFYSQDPIMRVLLALPGIDDPLDVEANDKEAVLFEISRRRTEMMQMVNSEGKGAWQKSHDARQVLAALDALEELYNKQAKPEIKRPLMPDATQPELFTEDAPADEGGAGMDVTNQPDEVEAAMEAETDSGATVKGGPGSGRYPAGSGGNESGGNDSVRNLTSDSVASILHDESNSEYHAFGLRVMTKNPKTGTEIEVRVGDTVSNSYQWDEGDSTGVDLGGVSVLNISRGSKPEYVSARIRQLKQYQGSKIVFIGGNRYEQGEDDNEIVISDPVVLKIWER
jgi:hypothetical protein